MTSRCAHVYRVGLLMIMSMSVMVLNTSIVYTDRYIVNFPFGEMQ